MKSLRVLHAVHGYPPESGGGIESYVAELLRGQQEQDAIALLLHGSFAPRPETRIEARDDLPWACLRLHRDDAYSDFWDRAHHAGASERFGALLDEWRPDIVHVHQWIRLSCDLVQVAEDAGIPTVVTLHDLSASCPACFRQRPDGSHCERVLSFESCGDCVPLRGHEGEREVRAGIELFADSMRGELLRARRVLAATEATAALVKHGLDAPQLEIHIQALGYSPRFADCRVPPLEPLETSEASTPSAPSTPLRLAYWGNVTARKGVDTLLQALRQVHERQSLQGRLELAIFGRCDSEELTTRLSELATGLPVTLRGRYEWQEIADFAPHVAVFPSDCFETYGFVLDEAFELGRPALVTGVGAFAERLQGGGWTVPPGDVPALAAQIEDLLAEPRQILERAAARPQISQALRQHVDAIFAHYEAARQTPPREARGPSAWQRLALEQLRRDRATLSPPTQRGLRRP
jgi:glycosyltransferase involved in cell wall biosynthesis